MKTSIQDSSRGLDFIRQLRPVDYVLIDSQKAETGFIAQEVEAIDTSFPGVIRPAHEKDYYKLAYTDFIPAIVKSIQELDRGARLDANQSASSFSHSNGAKTARTNQQILIYILGAIVTLLCAIAAKLIFDLKNLSLAHKKLAEAFNTQQNINAHAR